MSKSSENKETETGEKHPLQNDWHLWYYKPDKNKQWHENQLSVTSFSTVEDFWALYNHIELASNLQVGSDYSVFKNGIQPMWEDPRNKKGGRWVFPLNKKNTSAKDLDEMWLEVLLCVIGEGFDDESDQVCGVVVNIRGKMDKIAVWTSDYKNAQAVLKIGRILKQRMGYTGTVNYEAHEDTQSRQSNRPMYQC
ncbi:translation initiation factor 4F: cap-binding subunit-like protein [Dinothrombium tinctorium]|uniref:eIF-4F 25 kDa subunit n=1 Tax=Dinothrombium tinctorium TaxID=1965070 RepID=A0A3S3Q2N4_9ACAR|nr:translation initiation factor 4F: cap-binding subunit-like protein [Dinothrombium tinctorium]RWS12792.1 translation initiation factor 4F: cap-binding subunit-like protein [Dinothrombium tinctorium]RWS16774.1 translation initiation factor 4F: cap-binding subunit-like protein [Dinothrombium tinctorium]